MGDWRPTWASWVGVGVALFGPPVVAIALSGAPIGAAPAALTGNALLVLMAMAVLALARIEPGGLTSLRMRRPDPTTLALAAALLAANVLVVTPVVAHVAAALGGDFSDGVTSFRTLPLALRVAVVLVTPMIEEWLYRAYAIARIASWTGSRAVAVCVSSFVFAAAHAPLWGTGVAIALLVPSLFFGAAYAWRRDLAAFAIAHVATDALGLFAWTP
jgi:membrane protease YdiL (CAAX protease family)